MVQPRELFRIFVKCGDHPLLLSARACLLVAPMLLLLVAACGKTPPGQVATTSTAGVIEATAVPEDIATLTHEVVVSEGLESASDGAEIVEVEESEATPAPTITPEVEKQIVVCLGGSPASPFLYGDDSVAAEGLRQALYENLYTIVGYDYQARGLEKLPSLADGDAALETIVVNQGDRVMDIKGNVVTLVKDVIVLNSDAEEVKFDGTPMEMRQMVVDFAFQPMVWSDGTPVTAKDSVFSFQLASDPQTIFGKNGLATTASYVATDERGIRWTGIPGYMDQTYFLNVWQPLPSHQLIEMSAVELKTADETNKAPLSNGPYVVTDWTAEDELVLARNEYYYRQEEDLPVLDRIIVRFGDGEDFLAGDPADACDVISNGAIRFGNLPLLEMAVEQGKWQVISSPGTVFEHIAFGISPVKEYAERRPDWFEDTRVRQAMTMCTDRQSMIDELTDGRAELLHSYVSENHRLFPDDLQKWPYDPDQANALLDEAGYLDFSEDGRRQDVSSGIPMTITLGTNSESSQRMHVVEMFKDDLADCGIPVDTYDLPAGTWYAEGPVGRIFGRRFDLAQFAWAAKSEPDCGLYLSKNITGYENAGWGGWQNTNVAGWSNSEFDSACLAALNAMPAGDGYDDHQREALRVFSQEIPAIPLFTNVKVAAVRPWMKNVQLDPSQSSLLWNVSEWDIEQ